MHIRLEEEEIKDRPRLKKDMDRYTLILRLHGFDGEYIPYILCVIWKENSEEIVIKAAKETIEKIKKYLIKRDTPLDIIWSLLQYEYRTLDKLEEKIEKLQNLSLHHYSSDNLHEILKVKKTLFIIHRDYMRIRNLLEWTAQNKNIESSEILRDINELIDGIEYLIDGATVAIQLMQNTLTMKMNQAMKILTIIATIMMPLTLITGIYGMNFVNMPEIKWEYGYYYSLTLMLMVGLIMIYYFKKKELL